MLSNNAQERAPRWPASDALFSVAKIEDALLSASAEVTRELQRRWPAGKVPVSYATRAAYRRLARQQRQIDEALAAADRLRKQLARNRAAGRPATATDQRRLSP